MARKPRTVAFYRRRLPHWEVSGGLYFVTVNLAGAIPKRAATEIHEMSSRLAGLEGGEYVQLQRRILSLTEARLHKSRNVRDLVVPEVATAVMNAIRHREEKGLWAMIEYVVMPNHLHMFFQVREQDLNALMRGFKHWTAREGNKILHRTGQPFWQREWFDHWSRSPTEDNRIVRYIRANPAKAGLVRSCRDWPYASWAE